MTSAFKSFIFFFPAYTALDSEKGDMRAICDTFHDISNAALWVLEQLWSALWLPRPLVRKQTQHEAFMQPAVCATFHGKHFCFDPEALCMIHDIAWTEQRDPSLESYKHSPAKKMVAYSNVCRVKKPMIAKSITNTMYDSAGESNLHYKGT